MIEIIAPAIIIGLLIAITHSFLGIKVLQKGIVFIDLAVAQIAGFGVVLAGILFHDHGYLAQLFGFLFAIIASIFFFLIEKKAPDLEEAIIGSSFILFASLTAIFLSVHAHGHEEMGHLLSGQILFTTFKDVLWCAPIYLIISALWFAKPSIREGLSFYLIFALVITASVQLVGIYMVFASLIIPAIVARYFTKDLLSALICGIASVISGMIAAAILDLAAGALIVAFYAIIACLMICCKMLVQKYLQ